MTTDSTTPTTEDFAADLRALADFYEANPEFQLPYDVRTGSAIFNVIDSSRDLGELASALGGRRIKEQSKDGSLVYVRRAFGTVVLQVTALRDAACKRIQVGTRTVERDVVVGTEMVEEPVYKWECPPLLDRAAG